MNTPLISVIIPVHNGERHLADAIRSVLAQPYRPLEIIVVDDGSTDGGADIALTFPEVRCIRQPQQSVTIARNTGLRAAEGEWYAFIDQDDLWTPDKLRVQTEFLSAHPDVDYVLAHEEVFLDEGMTEHPDWLDEQYQTGAHIAPLPGTLLARKQCFEIIGPFDPAFAIASDTDWFARAEDAGLRKAILPDILLKKRIHRANLSAERKIIHQETFRLLRAAVHRKRERKG